MSLTDISIQDDTSSTNDNNSTQIVMTLEPDLYAAIRERTQQDLQEAVESANDLIREIQGEMRRESRTEKTLKFLQRIIDFLVVCLLSVILFGIFYILILTMVEIVEDVDVGSLFEHRAILPLK